MNENLFTIELGHYGFMLDTEWCYIALSWQLIITATLLTIGYKGYKYYKRTRKMQHDETGSPCLPTDNNEWEL